MRILLFASTAFLATSAGAAPSLDPMFGDHAVVQRGAPVRVRGTADPGEQVDISLAGQSRTAKAGRDGAWAADFPPLPEGGTYRLEARGKGGGFTSAEGLVAGDVWLCSGQSNMEWPLGKALNGEGEAAGARNPQIRLLKVPKNAQPIAQPFLAESVKWREASPESARDFSAACWFMGRALQQSHKVPIGLIDSTWGGTEIRSWMDAGSVGKSDGRPSLALAELHRRDPDAAAKAFGEQWVQWWRAHTGDKPGTEPWAASDRLRWAPMPKLGFWEQWGDPAFADFNGAIWARLRITLSAEEAAKAATLSLGAIDDADRTYVNGDAVGSTYAWNAPRNYALRPGRLKPGVNEIVVYVLDTGGGGGFGGPADVLKLIFADGSVRPLGQGWEYSIVPNEIGNPPMPPWSDAPLATTLYNGMIAPLGPIHLKGAAWYQGEADVGRPGYDQRLLAMMKAWRTQFREPQLPFLIVGLAGFGQPVAKPTASNWAATINEQRKATDADPRSALVSAIDIGERSDIHPPNKQEVGRRLALAAEALAYGDAKGMLTPKVVSAARTADGIAVGFDKTVISYGGAPVGVELCADTQESCRYAEARAAGSTLIVRDDGRRATRIRYAWADFPIANLYGPEKLAIPPFEVEIR
jgi:sialate O-acetylesterase